MQSNQLIVLVGKLTLLKIFIIILMFIGGSLYVFVEDEKLIKIGVIVNSIKAKDIKNEFFTGCSHDSFELSKSACTSRTAFLILLCILLVGYFTLICKRLLIQRYICYNFILCLVELGSMFANIMISNMYDEKISTPGSITYMPCIFMLISVVNNYILGILDE